MELKYSTKELLRDIKNMKAFAKQLLGKEKNYEQFLKYVLKLNYYKDGVYTPISIKEIQHETGLKYPIIRKYLHQIYEDLLGNDENQIDFSVQKVEYTFFLHYFDESAYFTVNHLPVVPRVGEQVEIPYFKAKVGTVSFHVDSIYYTFTDELQTVDIYLSPGKYNHYWPKRKDEAYLKGEITLHEYFSVKDYSLKEKLKLDRW